MFTQTRPLTLSSLEGVSPRDVAHAANCYAAIPGYGVFASMSGHSLQYEPGTQEVSQRLALLAQFLFGDSYIFARPDTLRPYILAKLLESTAVEEEEIPSRVNVRECTYVDDTCQVSLVIWTILSAVQVDLCMDCDGSWKLDVYHSETGTGLNIFLCGGSDLTTRWIIHGRHGPDSSSAANLLQKLGINEVIVERVRQN